ncbi:hypothetical protein HAPAU_28960 [Halalkalicoccus paucihalophilus]|uniref:Uncharacterized protein n=1 Tax=Halalkalicoccus paucihalophilus TaxID=1008153 RepID=A0A151ABR9_9EURY|nr:hypothetical protein [Halalkalicoccus paucihalophilus]KYH25075.1 hypothetical protein HAPAU_28960 [Halalkalicoccus paucihalophilus]
MIESSRHRVLALCVLLCALAGLLVFAGTMGPAPSNNHYPDGAEVAAEFAAYHGESVEVSGTVVGTDPVAIEVETDTDRPLVLTVLDIEGSVAVGQELRVFGTVQPGRTVVAHETVVVSSWETYYAWAVSFVAGVWVLVRFLRGWRFDRPRLRFTPREDHDA